MEATQTFTATLQVSTCRMEDGTYPATYHGFEALDELRKTLRAYGIEIEATETGRNSAKIKIGMAQPHEAARARTRNAGRPRKHALGHTLEELEAMGPERGAEALGCSRRTYYRRLSEMRKRAARDAGR